jgi:hypothetical protein
MSPIQCTIPLSLINLLNSFSSPDATALTKSLSVLMNDISPPATTALLFEELELDSRTERQNDMTQDKQAKLNFCISANGLLPRQTFWATNSCFSSFQDFDFQNSEMRYCIGENPEETELVCFLNMKFR